LLLCVIIGDITFI